MTKSGKVLCYFSHSFLKNISLDVKLQMLMSNLYSKRDIDVQKIKIKVKNAIFEFSAWSLVCPCIYFYNIYINVYGF